MRELPPVPPDRRLERGAQRRTGPATQGGNHSPGIPGAVPVVCGRDRDLGQPGRSPLWHPRLRRLSPANGARPGRGIAPTAGRGAHLMTVIRVVLVLGLVILAGCG